MTALDLLLSELISLERELDEASFEGDVKTLSRSSTRLAEILRDYFESEQNEQV
jgi:hypothetical protein